MSDPFDYRCPRCGTPMLDAGECGRGPDCRTPGDVLRALAAGARRLVMRAGRWLGLVA